MLSQTEQCKTTIKDTPKPKKYRLSHPCTGYPWHFICFHENKIWGFRICLGLPKEDIVIAILWHKSKSMANKNACTPRYQGNNPTQKVKERRLLSCNTIFQ